MTTDKAETELLLQLATKVHGWVETVQAIQQWLDSTERRQDSTERRLDEALRQVNELTRIHHNLQNEFETMKRENASNGR